MTHTVTCPDALASPPRECATCEALNAEAARVRGKKKNALRRVRRKKLRLAITKIQDAANEGDIGGLHHAAQPLFQRRTRRTCAAAAPEEVIEHLTKEPRCGFEEVAPTLAEEKQTELARAAAMTPEEREAREEVCADISDAETFLTRYLARAPWRKGCMTGSTPSALLRVAGPILIMPLMLLYSLIAAHGYWPTAARDATLFLLHKGHGAAVGLDGFRTLCLLSRIFLPFSKILADRVRAGILTHRYPAFATQFGFLPRTSTVHAILLIILILWRAQTMGVCMVVLLFDLRKAFDSINRADLQRALKAIELATGWIFVALDLHDSTGYLLETPMGTFRVNIPRGVRQGSIEGPSLFLCVYAVALSRAMLALKQLGVPLLHVAGPDGIIDLTLITFADDLSAMFPQATPLQMRVLIGELLAALREFFLLPALPKCKFLLMPFGNGARAWAAGWPAVGEYLEGDGWKIVRAASGGILGSSLTSGPCSAILHAELRRRRDKGIIAFDRIGKRVLASSQLSARLRLLLFQAYICSVLVYALEAHGSLSRYEMDKLEGTQNRMLRLMFPSRAPGEPDALDTPDALKHQEATVRLHGRLRIPTLEARIRVARLRLARTHRRFPPSLLAALQGPIAPLEPPRGDAGDGSIPWDAAPWTIALAHLFQCLRGEDAAHLGAPIPGAPALLADLGAPSSSPEEALDPWLHWTASLSGRAFKRLKRLILRAPRPPPPLPSPADPVSCSICGKVCKGWRGLMSIAHARTARAMFSQRCDCKRRLRCCRWPSMARASANPPVSTAAPLAATRSPACFPVLTAPLARPHMMPCLPICGTLGSWEGSGAGARAAPL